MKALNGIILLLAAAAFVAVSALATAAELPEADARKHLKGGAVVVDVRTAEEFKARHVAGVTNIPLAELKQSVSGVVTNKSQVILLHCKSGRRSGIAEGELRAMGYTNAFNIGSFERAEKIVGSRVK
jgi:phage shock protein E